MFLQCAEDVETMVVQWPQYSTLVIERMQNADRKNPRSKKTVEQSNDDVNQCEHKSLDPTPIDPALASCSPASIGNSTPRKPCDCHIPPPGANRESRKSQEVAGCGYSGALDRGRWSGPVRCNGESARWLISRLLNACLNYMCTSTICRLMSPMLLLAGSLGSKCRIS